MPGPRGSGRGGLREWDSSGADGRDTPGWRERGLGRGRGGFAGDSLGGNEQQGQGWRGRGRGGGGGRGQGRGYSGGGEWERRGGSGGRGMERGRGGVDGVRNWREEVEKDREKEKEKESSGGKEMSATGQGSTTTTTITSMTAIKTRGDAAATATGTPATATATTTTTPPSSTAPPASSSRDRDGRLKPPRDACGGHGLVSKGDTTLLSPTAQQTLFTTLLTTYTPFLKRISTLPRGPLVTPPTQQRTQAIDTFTATAETLLLALRSLREALLATGRVDDFAKNVYKFNARTAIMLQNKESYLPALLHLLRNIHQRNKLTRAEVAEFAGYYVVHLACVGGDVNEAYIVRREYRVLHNVDNGNDEDDEDEDDEDDESSKNPKLTTPWADVDAILRALVRNDYFSWAQLRGRVRVETRRLMELGEEKVMFKRLVSCLGKTYFEVGKAWVEGLVGMEVAEVMRRVEGAGEWEVCGDEDGEGETGKVVVRKRPGGNKVGL